MPLKAYYAIVGFKPTTSPAEDLASSIQAQFRNAQSASPTSQGTPICLRWTYNGKTRASGHTVKSTL